MNFLTIKQTTDFKNKVFGKGTLISGETYFTYSQFAEETVNQGIGEIIFISRPSFHIIDHTSLERIISCKKRILLYFPGGFGDAVMAGMVLPHVEDKLGIQIDICCSREKWLEIFRPMGMKSAWIAYPPTLETLALYNGVITDFTSIFPVKGIKVSPVMQICSPFGIRPEELPEPFYEIDEESKLRLKLPESSAPKLGVNFDSNGAVKSYPPDLHHELLRELKQVGFDIFILGNRPPGHTAIPEKLAIDTRTKTSISELALLISQMDFIIAMDSFICHLANIMSIPTNVLLSATSAGFFSLHSNIECMPSGIECSPCYKVFDDCPLDYQDCKAFYHRSITPSIIAASAVRNLLNSSKKRFTGKDTSLLKDVI